MADSLNLNSAYLSKIEIHKSKLTFNYVKFMISSQVAKLKSMHIYILYGIQMKPLINTYNKIQ